jgi:hypothetical protein
MIRVDLLPREEKAARAGAPSLKLNVRVGDMVLPWSSWGPRSS